MRKYGLFAAKATKEAKGLYGEWSVDFGISAAQKMGFGGRILHNAYVPKGNGAYTEIDVLYVTRKGIFVFESKNYVGWIFGDGESTYWTIISPSRVKHQFYNPMLQNKGHIQHLLKHIPHSVPCFSVITYSDRCQIQKMSKVPNDTYMVHYSDIPLIIQQVWASHPDIMDDTQVVELFNALSMLRSTDLNIINAHTQSVRNSAMTTVSSDKICPMCGGKLIVRTARKGNNIGHQFWGCQNYPNCQYTAKL